MHLSNFHSYIHCVTHISLTLTHTLRPIAVSCKKNYAVQTQLYIYRYEAENLFM